MFRPVILRTRVYYATESGAIKLTKNSPNVLAVAEYSVRATKYGESKTIKLHSPLTAIDIYNRRDNLYDEKPLVQDNRTYNVLITDGGDEARDRFNKLLAGKKPEIIDVEEIKEGK